ncbi:MAG: prepilin peptidase [Chloroflexi bacterium]|nr:prepilin peptidase [Chloroflexota bacterium]
MEIILFALLGLSVGIGIDRAAEILPTRAPIWRIPFRAPLTWFASAILFAIAWTRFGWTIQLALALVYTAIFLHVLIVDYEHRLILNVVILPAIALALALSPFARHGWQLALLGGALSFALVFLIYLLAPIYSRWRKHKLAVPFGAGDVKLAAFMGLVTGFPGSLYALGLAIILGGLAAIGAVVLQFARTRKIDLGAAIAYGPYFCIAGWVVMIFV